MRSPRDPTLFLPALALVCGGLLSAPVFAAAEPGASTLVLVVHGGAGTIRKQELTPELENEYREKLAEGLLAGYRILRDGGTSLDAVEATIRLFEDSALFNAGKGSVFTAEGRNELDASIMDGATLQAGAVAGVTNIRHPITAARAVMEKTPHVMLAGKGAEVFAEREGLEMVEPSFFYTERRWRALQKAKEKERARQEAESGDSAEATGRGGDLGTVGAVALDLFGNLAAGTSTGGRTNKRFGRVGDSPIIGAGTYANDRCGVSGTGHGEYFILYAVAYDICARMTYQGASLSESAETVVLQQLKQAGGDGGVIALDTDGNLATPFNTEGMYRGYIRADGVPHVEIYQ